MIYIISPYLFVDLLPLPDTSHSKMANTHNQALLHLQTKSKQHTKKIHRITYDLASTNSKLETFQAKVKDELAKVKGELTSIYFALNQFLRQYEGSPSYEQTSH
jgi:hypothetical protein